MNKKKLIALALIIVVACTSILLAIYSFDKHKTEPFGQEVAISQVDLKSVEGLMIGSEPPRLLYADREMTVFDCRGIYVYDRNTKKLAQSFDTSSLVQGKQQKLSSFVTEDGNYIIFGVSGEGSSSWYIYSFKDDIVKTLPQEEYESYHEKMFICTRLTAYEDELYQKSSGVIADIGEDEYVYLSFKDWKVSTIEAVYVKRTVETRYSVFATASVKG